MGRGITTMNKYVFEISGIKWDTDGVSPKSLGLPKSIKEFVIPADNFVDASNQIEDALSDEYEYCVFSFVYRYVGIYGKKNPFTPKNQLNEIHAILKKKENGEMDAESALGFIEEILL